ncbi:MAG: putative ABC exporter domain-containing protein, partial [Lachnospiraceae bacterium]|nr:putative ABC exporter domain-containing protein [Lachnospiraceae bacterium]
MNAIFYLVGKSVKNTILEVLHKPVRLIMWIFVILMMAVMIVASVLMNHEEVAGLVPVVYTKVGFFVVLALILIFSVRTGLTNGGTIFDMCDVNILFVTPVDSRKVLLYGVLRMAKTSFLMCFILLFQAVNFRNLGIPMHGMFYILLALLLAMCLIQMLTLIIYSATNSRPKRKNIVKILTVALFVPIILTVIFLYLKDSTVSVVLEQTVASPAFRWTPIIGWAASGAIELIFGTHLTGICLFGMVLMGIVAAIAYISKSNPDYYEDVLMATETAFERKRDIAAGNVAAIQGAATKKVKVRAEGISGWGSSAIFHKHLRETFRMNFLGLWGIGSFAMIGGAVLYSYFLREAGVVALITTLALFMYFKMFFIGQGRGIVELTMPYIYMIPEAPLKKLIWSSAEILLKDFGEAMVMFLGVGLITRNNLVAAILCGVVYWIFSLVVMGVNYISLRFSGGGGAGLLVMLYMLLTIGLLLPGLIPA